MSKHYCRYVDLIPDPKRNFKYRCTHCDRTWIIYFGESAIQVTNDEGELQFINNESRFYNLPLDSSDDWVTLHLHNF